MVARDFFGHVRHVENARKIQPLGFPVRYTLPGFEQIRTTNQVFKFANAHGSHEFAHFFGDKEKEVHDMFGLAGKFLPKHWVLRCHTDRTRIEMAFAHHDAALHDQWRRRKTKFVCAQQRADQHIATGFHLAVDLDRDTATQAIQHQRLLRFSQAQFPRRARVFDRRNG